MKDDYSDILAYHTKFTDPSGVHLQSHCEKLNARSQGSSGKTEVKLKAERTLPPGILKEEAQV